MEKINVIRTGQSGIRALSKKLIELLNDKNSQIYEDNVTKFGIPEEYVRHAFSEGNMLEAATSGKSHFYLALENRCKILGFAQVIRRNKSIVELDRILVFPENTRKWIGTQLLKRVLKDQKKEKTNKIIVNTGKEEDHARRFYEKNGFQLVGEKTVETPWHSMLTLVTYELEINANK
jgi:GNAT superfamily N-acetyltransferase